MGNKAVNVLKLGHDLAEDALNFQQQAKLPSKDLFMALLIAQRILQDVLFQDQSEYVFSASQEADATYQAANATLTGN